MDVFDLRDKLITDYESYIRSFIQIQDSRISQYVQSELAQGLLWPEPLIQLNPAFEAANSIDALVDQGVLHDECRRIFRLGKTSDSDERVLCLHRHQEEAVCVADSGHNYVLTTGTGSGKSLSYIIPIVNHVLRQGKKPGIKAIIVYPMNALANSQFMELGKFLCAGYGKGLGPVTFQRYTGQETDAEKQAIIDNPPDILLTNYVMLELILTRREERQLVRAANGLKFLVLDELHTYRGRQGADVALLVRRTRDFLAADKMQCVGTSATISTGSDFENQRAEIAQLASRLFGDTFLPANIIGETLRRITPFADLTSPDFVARLKASLLRSITLPVEFHTFCADSLSIWIESVFGIQQDEATGRLVRAKPRTIGGPEGAGQDLAQATGVAREICEERIRTQLLAGYDCRPDSGNQLHVFAFRLHQFISRGDTVLASLEQEQQRYITLNAQKYVPDDRSRVLLPLAFCRECGQEYYSVRVTKDKKTGSRIFEPRDVNDRLSDDESEAGFIFMNTEKPWPTDPQEVMSRLPDDWLEQRGGTIVIRRSRRTDLPEAIRITSEGIEDENGHDCSYVTAPFRFCLNCGVSYGFRQSSDFAKLATLGSGGRSTAATVMCLSVIRNLKLKHTLPQVAQKLLSFTDNRQDASLQAGHFNDFIEVGILRAALYHAAMRKGESGLHHDELTQQVFTSLAIPFESYAANPSEKFGARIETDRAFRDVLGYRIYRDLKRGWRITSPNLEQCGLLGIDYLSLDEVCKEESEWSKAHPALAQAKPETRLAVAKTLLDYMRRELAIKTTFLDRLDQERMQQRSSQKLTGPWAIDDSEISTMEHAAILFPRSQQDGDYGGNVFLSPRGGFAQYLRRTGTFPNLASSLAIGDAQALIQNLLDILMVAGIVSVAQIPSDPKDAKGYQLESASMIWKAAAGEKPFYDPISMPQQSESVARTNKFFVDFYKQVALNTHGIRAKEHTAQVPSEQREEREAEFREGKLPVLFCSPTMELGVDISELNVVNMRNVPPTPANYAQRSGRAGRSGQPALVFSYCTTGSSHDQYFFKRPHLMVSGAVLPPRLDLTNEDLVRAHIQATWLAETGESLGRTLCDVLDVNGDNPTLKLQDSVRDGLSSTVAKSHAMARARRILATISDDLESSDWYTESWLDDVFNQLVPMFDAACDRWRSLYKSALDQAKRQDKVIRDATRSVDDRRIAERLRKEAEAQHGLLTDSRNVVQSDFYSYRYFASEGFLPGYNFPRLPLSAFIPGQRGRNNKEEFLSRPRFLAITEFGPRSIIYHEGSRFIINKVILPVAEKDVLLTSLKQCQHCGYMHPSSADRVIDCCENCNSQLSSAMGDVFKLQNVSTKRRERINSDEEERQRQGYEIRTGFAFSQVDNRLCRRLAIVVSHDVELATLTYGHAATLFRVNLGWTRRENKQQYGYVLDLERGYWERNNKTETDDAGDSLSANCRRVIPYVEDRKNCIILEPKERLSLSQMTSLQAAFKNAMQVVFQLEDSELATERLPDSDNPHMILFYEAAEGGAGVLRRLVDDPKMLSQVARQALSLCHFDPDSGNDMKKALGSREDCEAACYNCLMSYSNQRDHSQLDRKDIRDTLMKYASAQVNSSSTNRTRSEQFEYLMRLADSTLEKEWLQFIYEGNYSLPSHGQYLVEACSTRPDFYYETHRTAVYIDGPIHKYPERGKRDAQANERMENSGYIVIRFGTNDDWPAKAKQYPGMFGRGS